MSAPSPAPFPYAHSGEPRLPAYLRTRAEGLPLRESLWSGLSYVRKWRDGKWTAPPEEVRYFDHQRQLLRRLAAEGPEPGAARLVMVGDLMWVRSGWHSFVSPGVLDHLNAHDVVLGNLESVISARFKVPWLLPDYFSYNSDPGLVTSFRRPDGRNTFTALATCNNHTLDRGDEGMRDTLAFLDAQGVRHAGVRRDRGERPFVTWQSKGITFGFYAACWGLNNPDLSNTTGLHIEVLPGLVPSVRHPVDLGNVRAALAGMSAAGADFKIVCLHWGHEFELYPTPDLMQVGREIVRAGADVVMGSHPHVVQPLEVCFVNGYERRYKEQWDPLPALEGATGCVLSDGGAPRKGLIAYSLGNFVTVMYGLHCQIGLAAGLEVHRDPVTGRADWRRPELRLVHTVQRDRRTGGRRLVLLDEYLQEREAKGRRERKLARMGAVLREHLLGRE
jgi:poly-gamma-glutamate synthesis protein (capsule biosynthesis protein)